MLITEKWRKKLKSIQIDKLQNGKQVIIAVDINTRDEMRYQVWDFFTTELEDLKGKLQT